MKALVLEEYNRLEIQELPEPECGPDEVLVAVKWCGICGSDVQGMDGSTGRRRPPIVMGHEAAGTIAAVGREVRDWKIGDAVTMDSTIHCGACAYCRGGRVNLCSNRRVLGVSCEEYRRPGAFAQYVAVPQRVLYRVPLSLPFEHAAMVEPLSIALHAVGRTQPSGNDSAVVIGVGMIGLLLVQSLVVAGCRRILAVDVAEDKLRLAREFGADAVVNPTHPAARRQILDWAGGEGADIAFEAVGTGATVNLAIQSVRKGGAVTLVGNLSPNIDWPLQAVVTREITVYGSCASCGEYPACLDHLASGRIRVAPLISALAPLEDGPEWFARLHRKEPGVLKVMLHP